MHYRDFSDKELWRDHQNGDIRAYNELFQRYAPLLYKQAIRWIKIDFDAEELVMDLLLNLWIKRNELNPDAGSNLKAYLARAMRNRIVNYFHKNLQKLDSQKGVNQSPKADSRGADYTLRCKEMDQLYESSLRLLSPQRLKVFKMSREEGLTYAQIAKRLNLSLNTVKNYMASALATLRDNHQS